MKKATEEFVGTARAARSLGVSEATVRRMANIGVCDPIKIEGRRLFSPSDLAAAKKWQANK